MILQTASRLALLRQYRTQIIEIARRNGVSDVWVFGSTARGEDGPASDIDLLVTLEPGHSLLDLARMKRELESLLNCEVDVITKAGLRARLRPQVLAEAVAL